MEVTFQKVNDILKTLPVGYYLGMKATVQLDPDSSTSFCNPIDGEIHVAFRNIQDILKNSPLDSVDNTELEQFIRTILYHEVSHLILTGDCSGICYGPTLPEWFNVFEDERIENLLASYYKNINFKKVLVRLNGWTPETPDNTPEQYFYSICRFRRGPKKFVDKVSELIRKYRLLNASSPKRGNLGKRDYYDDIDNFWNEVRNDFLKGNFQPQSQNSGSQENQDESEKTEGSEPTSGNQMSQDKNAGQSSEKDNAEEKNWSEEQDAPESFENEEAEKVARAIEEEIKDNDISKNMDSEVVSEIIQKSMTDIFGDQKAANDILLKLERIMARVSKRKASSSLYSEGYAGKVNPRSVLKRNDYRWFVHRNPEGCLRMGAKLHLNLWIDQSGSFGCSMPKINQLLFAVNQFAKHHPNDFSFSVVTMDDINQIHKNNLPVQCGGGNRFGPDVPEIWRTLSKTQAGKHVYNVVVWDGDLKSDIHRMNLPDYISKYRDAWRILNNAQTIIVSDTTNAKYIDKGAKSAKKVYIIEDYAEKFIDEVFKLLSQVIVA